MAPPASGTAESKNKKNGSSAYAGGGASTPPSVRSRSSPCTRHCSPRELPKGPRRGLIGSFPFSNSFAREFSLAPSLAAVIPQREREREY